MEVSVQNARGIPDGSILSIRAGQVRRQGAISCTKPMQFDTSVLKANPFKIDIFAPLASKRLTLAPHGETYAVTLDGNGQDMALDICVRELNGNQPREVAIKSEQDKEERREKASQDTQDYIEEHGLVIFVQNLMQNILAEKPADPLLYMEQHLSAARAKVPKVPSAPKLSSPQAKKPKVGIQPISGKTFESAAFTVQDATGAISVIRPLKREDVMPLNMELRRLRVPSLSERFSSKNVLTPLERLTSSYQDKSDVVTQTLFLEGGPARTYQMLRAGPRKYLHFEPSEVTAAIVTCGGLCPGLNSVIREVVMMLHAYGVDRIYGIKGGYKGVVQPDSWIELTPETVQEIHMQGGTMLVSDRGNPPIPEMAQTLKDQNVKQYFVIGGDGTLRGAMATFHAMEEINHECSVIGVPKTIDNDIPVIDKTFGFDTACTEARKAIDAAYVEATCNANCIGLVKLMGRHAGYIAMNAVLAARNVDMCLLPEMDLSMDKVVQHALSIMQRKGFAVIVVAEGCGDTLMRSSGECDAGGNKKLPDVGPWLRDQLLAKFKEVRLPLTIKYIDPTYMVRAVPATSTDSVYCTVLAQNAVHAAMAGHTGVTVGRVQMRFCVLPIDALVKSPSKRVDTSGRWFQRLISTTGQPSLAPDVPSMPPSPSHGECVDALVALSDAVDLGDIVPSTAEIRRVVPEHLGALYGERAVPTTLEYRVVSSKYRWMDEHAWTTQTIDMKDDHSVRLQMLRAGPRKTLYFQPESVAAAIVTCGGLCPGLNNVVREVVMMLYTYGVRKVYGIRGGFKGVAAPHTWTTLTPDNVQDIHLLGGTVLVSDRGSPPDEEMATALQKKGVRQYFVIGGDGTHRGALATYRALRAVDHECAVIGIPKTIDNDINLLDRTFGFDTACTEAERAIDTAYVEATCNANCIGLVKLMGRHCGYIAMQAVLAARHVDMCLLPEMDITLDKVLEYAVHLLKTLGRAVIVVAEGCGETMLQGSGETDAGGNKKMPDVGPFLKDKLLSHFKDLGLPCTVKYIDPTYMIRAVPANAKDSIYCSILAHAAVHGAMAGYTNITCAKIDERFVYLPIPVIGQAGNRKVELAGPWYERLIATTQQPHLGAQGIALATPVDPRRSRRTLQKKGGMLPGIDEVSVPDVTLTVTNGFGKTLNTRPLRREDLMHEGDNVRVLPCFHLSERFGEQAIISPLAKGTSRCLDSFSWSTQAMKAGTVGGGTYYQMTRAGPRETLYFDPCDPAGCAAIVSCGGICPGLNSVIREIVNTLWQYGVRRIYGIIGGYKGVVEPDKWIQMTPELVRDIHTQGGTMLVSDRGNPPHSAMAQTLKDQNVKQYFVLGGDGTHQGAMQTFEGCLKIDHECSVVGIPKTIDNDIPMVDQTFGFDSACTEARKAVESAYVEARSNANCIGLVKLMGRHCGHITLNAALASGFVDICLLPEMSIDIDKLLAHITHLMRTKQHAVIVVAEGCGDTIISSGGETDAGGNKKLADVGEYLKKTISAHCKAEGIAFTIKFIDPTYMIRSVPANSYDSVYCSVLAQNAVHGAMAGFSGITVGRINGRYVYLPIHAITMQKGKRVDTKGVWFTRMLHSTQQPELSPDQEFVPEPPNVDVLASLSSAASVNSVLTPGDNVHRLEVTNLKYKYASAMVPNPLKDEARRFVSDQAWMTHTLQQFNRRDAMGHTYFQLLLGGAREYLHFDPTTSNAVIVSCGGLCPGLNAVIREITVMLLSYGVNKVYGCIGGYKGLVEPEKWIELTAEKVQDIHLLGGSMLVSDRGNPPHIEIAKSLQRMNVKQYFVLGGDGTHKGGNQTFEAMQEIGHECAVVGVPKTIDNDIPLLDHSFGYNTACTEAQKAIDSAYIEATCTENCIGIVKLMGRHCGFVAMGATLAARHVDICLLPEMEISLPKVLSHVLHLMRTQKYAVIVVAEGCGDTLIKSSGETDAGGNKKLADVGPWLKEQLAAYFKKMKTKCQIKYIDPTYMIRAVPANPNDTVYCTVLGQYAVHAAMAGYTGITVGKVDENYVMVPIHAIVDKPQRVNIKGRQFQRLVHTTGQPSLESGPGDDWALLPPVPDEGDDEEPPFVPPPEIDIRDWKGFARMDTSAALAEEVVVPGTVLKVLSGLGDVLVQRELQRADVLQSSDQIRKLEVMKLMDKWWQSSRTPTTIRSTTAKFQPDDSWTVQAFQSQDRVDSVKGTPYYHMMRAGPRENLYFDPTDDGACAAIITCGALCPGINSVIREIVLQLTTYGMKRIYGIRHGFKGIPRRDEWLELSPSVVENINTKGGSILGNADGTPHVSINAKVLAANNVKQLFMIGGDGTLKGAMQTLTALTEINHPCAVVNVPKTIDNDIPIMDKTFGFDTACTEARKAIDAAYVEAIGNANCIGLVKVFGRESGFIALNSSMASRVVDICLLPEMDADLSKVIDHCETIMAAQGYGVIVVAEGCNSLCRGEADNTGIDVGVYLKDAILKRFKEKEKVLTIKYIDPTYMIGTVPANANDSVYCSDLAQHAVHGAMAGFTGISVARVYGRYVYLPCHACIRSPKKQLNVNGRWVARLLASTKQPNFQSEGCSLLPPATEMVDSFAQLTEMSAPMSLNMVLHEGDQVHRMELNHLATKFASKELPNPLREMFKNLFVSGAAWSTQTFRSRQQEDTDRTYLQMLRSGPREVMHFNPQECAAALVTCGGICPGLNSVIREVVRSLKAYGVQKVYGIIGGFKGCTSPDTWIELTEEVVQDIHTKGGSILVSDRGNPPHSEIASVLAGKNIRQYFVLGGDGTHKGAMQTYDEMMLIDHECSVVGIPKTIDNDIALLDTSFGFDTACTEAAKAIDSAYVEATTNSNCIGLVKLMGRHCGFIAMRATMAARNVDVVLLPEMRISQEKLMDYIVEVMKKKRSAVIVVAEGCGDTLIQSAGGTDAGGNKILADVGLHLKAEITSHFKRLDIPLSIKYIDPTYMIRSVPANAYDSVYCAMLAQHAVHGAMAGYSGITVGKVDERYVMLPIHAITDKGQRKVDVDGREFEMLLGCTRQPSFAP